MRRRTLGVKKEPTIMIIPMIDIVFFLLVFWQESFHQEGSIVVTSDNSAV